MINPGNPVGAVLEEAHVAVLVAFAATNGLVLLAEPPFEVLHLALEPLVAPTHALALVARLPARLERLLELRLRGRRPLVGVAPREALRVELLARRPHLRLRAPPLVVRRVLGKREPRLERRQLLLRDAQLAGATTRGRPLHGDEGLVEEGRLARSQPRPQGGSHRGAARVASKTPARLAVLSRRTYSWLGVTGACRSSYGRGKQCFALRLALAMVRSFTPPSPS